MYGERSFHSTKKQRYFLVEWGFSNGTVDIKKLYDNELPAMRDTYTVLNHILKEKNYKKETYINLLNATLEQSLDEVKTNFKTKEFKSLLINSLKNQRDIETILREYKEIAQSI